MLEGNHGNPARRHLCRILRASRWRLSVHPDGTGRSELTIAVIEKQLDTRGIGRNWNTVLKIQAMVEATVAPGLGRA